jgi:benzoyl-CoA reductase subunit A
VRVYLGIDLGSTTTKAVLLDESGTIVGRGLTNTRANFEAASSAARAAALADARLTLVSHTLPNALDGPHQVAYLRRELERSSRRHRLSRLRERAHALAEKDGPALERATDALFVTLSGPTLDAEAEVSFQDAVLSAAAEAAEFASASESLPYETVMGVFERALVVDEADPTQIAPEWMLEEIRGAAATPLALREAIGQALAEPIAIVGLSGTGYGRHRLPFAKSEIRSEILCHGLGAHLSFPQTRTILDIGGQDIKAIQLDAEGLVTSFQMNDRCAAGCGRYLGYVAEELGVGITELGPLAGCSSCPSRINSTCTVFAGAEIRERLALGEKREDVVAGLHRAIVLRAIGLLARSGGVHDQLTFSGGVARNETVVRMLRHEIVRHYGTDITLNVSRDSIFGGAIGAATFARTESRTAC